MEEKLIMGLEDYSLDGRLPLIPIIAMPSVSAAKSDTMLINSNSNSIENQVDELHITNKKKIRRKPRKKKTALVVSPLVDAAEDDTILNMVDSDMVLSFKILAVTNQTNAKVFRKKTGICCRHVNVNYSSDFKGGGVIKNCSGFSNKFLPCTSRIAAITNDLVPEDGNKTYIKIQNGIYDKILSTPHVDNSKLQLSNAAVQQATRNLPKRKRQPKLKSKEKKFPTARWSMQQIVDGLKDGEFIQGTLRINSKGFREAYVSSEDQSEQDLLIPSIVDRNRALEGDVVAVKLKKQEDWNEKQKTAVVVCVLEEIHSRTAVGFLQIMPDKNQRFVQFIPRDVRIPRMKIPVLQCPATFYQHPNRFENMLFRAKIVKWDSVKYPVGALLENIGVVNDLESESAALLAEHCLDVTPFEPELLEYVSYTNVIPKDEFEYREDLRKECIFTIDPSTARDLDDAVSCKELENGNLEIGVHISDVTFYLKENTPLDARVCKKATTIYLVNEVFHMLPVELCKHCSLLPGLDKLAFSVIWEMTKTGDIINYRFSRSVINSCAQLAYEHAQSMIEDPSREFDAEELPQIMGGFTSKDLSKTVNYLQNIAVNLRAERFENGALRIDQTKLTFKLDEQTGEPIDYFVYENKEANRLIEEFMLLANMFVAQKILDDFPKLAFLRCHQPPKDSMLVELKNTLEQLNIELDISSSKAIQTSIQNIGLNQSLDSKGLAALCHLIAKPMQRAKYFCAGIMENEKDFEHYSLHAPIYTHFTSPIRRYADIMVHRLLAASLGYNKKPNWTAEYVSKVAATCNTQKYNAKCAGEASSDLYLATYIADHQPFIRSAVVISVKHSSFDVLVVATGSIIRMYPNNFDESIEWSADEEDSRKFNVVFPATSEQHEQSCVIQLFSVVTVGLYRKSRSNKLDAKLVRPIDTIWFSRQN